MKRSHYVGLVALGTLTIVIVSCREKTFEIRQQTYASREDCAWDWGADSDKCTSTGGGGGGSGGGRGSYTGPRYYWDRDTGHPVIVDADGTTHAATTSHVGPEGSSTASAEHVSSVSRGGFGESAHGFGEGHGSGGGHGSSGG